MQNSNKLVFTEFCHILFFDFVNSYYCVGVVLALDHPPSHGL